MRRFRAPIAHTAHVVPEDSFEIPYRIFHPGISRVRSWAIVKEDLEDANFPDVKRILLECTFLDTTQDPPESHSLYLQQGTSGQKCELKRVTKAQSSWAWTTKDFPLPKGQDYGPSRYDFLKKEGEQGKKAYHDAQLQASALSNSDRGKKSRTNQTDKACGRPGCTDGPWKQGSELLPHLGMSPLSADFSNRLKSPKGRIRAAECRKWFAGQLKEPKNERDLTGNDIDSVRDQVRCQPDMEALRRAGLH